MRPRPEDLPPLPSEHLATIAGWFGHVWDDNPARQRRVLDSIARSYWHVQRRAVAQAKRLRQTRRAAVEFCRGQQFDALTAHVAKIEAEREVASLRLEVARLKELVARNESPNA